MLWFYFKKYILSTLNYSGLYRDYKNRIYIKEQYETHKDTSFFKSNDIFINWYNHMCILVSLSKEDIELTEGEDLLEDGVFYDKLNVINTYITNRMLLGDLLVPYVKRIPNTYSYKLIYKQYCEVFSIWFVLRNIIFYTSLIYLICL
jgi:hypothetical protein